MFTSPIRTSDLSCHRRSYRGEADGRRFSAETGNVVSLPGEMEYGFCNGTDMPARQYILIAPTLDAVALYTELAESTLDGVRLR